MKVEPEDDDGYGWIAAFGLVSLVSLFMFDLKLGAWWVFYGLFKRANKAYEKRKRKTNPDEPHPERPA